MENQTIKKQEKTTNERLESIEDCIKRMELMSIRQIEQNAVINYQLEQMNKNIDKLSESMNRFIEGDKNE